MVDLKSRLGAVWARFGIELSGVVFLLVPALAWLLGCNVGNAIIWATGVVLLAYTIETRGMRREMIRQNEMVIRPLMITSVEYNPSKQDYRVLLRNIGKGPALYIQMRDIEVTSAGGYRLSGKFGGFDCVESGKDADVDSKLTLEGKGEKAQLKRDFAASLHPQDARKRYDLDICYEDIDGRKYKSVMQMGQGGIRLLSHGRVEV